MEGYGENVVLIAIGRGPPLLFGRVHFGLKRGELLRIGAIAR